MATNKRFHQNLQLWARLHPKEAVLLPYIESSSVFPCTTDEGEPNLYVIKGKKKAYFHSQKGARSEAKEWFKTLSLRNIQVLYIYGVGLGYFYEAAKSWMKKKPERSLVFLEDDLGVLRHFLETDCATELLKDPQTHLVFLKEGADKWELLDELYWNFALTKAAVTALPFYKKEKTQFLQELVHEIDYTADLKFSLIEEYLNFGGSYFINYYRNMLAIPHSYLGNHLFGKFEKVPAIICGAGPSLEKNAALLHQLQGRAVIFAGGSAINVLNAAGIQPHFGAGIDPNRAQEVRLRATQAFEVPFFYRNRLNHEAFNTIHGPHLYITGSGGYDVAEFFEGKLGIEGVQLEEGHNVVTFSLEVAQRLGCDPIIFLGLDLAFTDKKLYSQGVAFDMSVEEKALKQYENFEEKGLLRKDIYGKPLYTLWKWVAESEWMAEWAKGHPDTRLINCTEGGLGCPGVPNMPLAEATQKYCRESWDLRNWIHGEIQNSRMPQVTLEKVEEAMREMMESLQRCEAGFTILIQETEKVKEKIHKDHATAPHLQSGRAALVETEMAEEAGYLYILNIFNAMYIKLLTRELRQIKAGKRPREEWRKNILRMDLNKKRLEFLRDAARVNVETIAFAFEEKEKGQGQPAKVEKMILHKIDLPKESKPRRDKGGKSGAWKTYYASRAVKSEVHYKDGLFEGPCRFLSEDGRVLAEAHYKDGRLEGESRWYYETGELYSVQRYLSGVWHGKQEYYYANGRPKTMMEYNKGVLVTSTLIREFY